MGIFAIENRCWGAKIQGKQVLGSENAWKTGVGERKFMENRSWGAKIHGKQVLGSENAWKTAVGEQKFNRTCLLLKV